jgi:hypothetical protein
MEALPNLPARARIRSFSFLLPRHDHGRFIDHVQQIEIAPRTRLSPGILRDLVSSKYKLWSKFISLENTLKYGIVLIKVEKCDLRGSSWYLENSQGV